jgi:two-component system, chemotaxis family, CheB/CheR fusion protein
LLKKSALFELIKVRPENETLRFWVPGCAMRIMPYRTAENVIDGLVLTFVAINPVKAAEKRLSRMSKVFLDGLEPMFILDLSGRILDLNAGAARKYGWSRQELIDQPVNKIVPKTCARGS